MNTLSKWVLASRPKTLPAIIGPVILGNAVAYKSGRFSSVIMLITIVSALFIQIGTNFVNDLHDYIKGSDTEDRKGPLRVVTAGLISPKKMKNGIRAVFSASFILGLILVYHMQSNFGNGYYLLFIGILSIISAYAYTAGPFPLAYNGLGDIFVIIFFGIIAVCGSFFVQTGFVNREIFILSVPVGLLINNVLVINNYRDYQEDCLNKKKTLIALMGRKFGYAQYISSLIISLIIPIYLYFTKLYWPIRNAVWGIYILVPLAIMLAIDLRRKKDQELNTLLAKTSMFSMIYSIIISIVYLIN